MPVQRIVAAASAAVLLMLSVAGAAQEPSTAPTVSATPPAEPDAPVSVAEPLPAPCCTVPARTPIDIEFVDTINSRANNNGDRFAFRLAEPLVVDGQVLAPAGTPGVGEVVHAAHASFGGKAGELILAVRYLDLNGTRIPLRSLRYGPRQGRDNSGAVTTGAMVAAAVLPVASVLAFVISGGEVNIPAGTRANAMTSTEISLPPVE